MKTQEDIYQMLQDVLIEEFEIEASDISLDANLYTDLDLDSIDANCVIADDGLADSVSTETWVGATR